MNAAPPPTPDQLATTPVPPTPAPAPRRRRFWRWLVTAFVLFLLLVVIAPHAVALPAVRDRIAEELADQLAAPVRIGRIGFSWFTGLAVRDVEIGNPPDFATDRPALRLQRAALEVPLLTLLRGDVVIAGTLTGVEVFVEQRADGDSNLQALAKAASRGASGSTGEGSSRPDRDPDGHAALRALRCELTLHDGRIELRRDGSHLETLVVTDCRVQKPHGSDRLTAQVAVALPAGPPASANAAATAGRAQAEVHAGLVDHAIAATLRLETVDLQRLAPFAAAFAPGQLTTVAGIAHGELSLTRDADTAAMQGQLTIDEPRLAGPLLAGLALQAPRWLLVPALRREAGRLDTRGSRLDLGCLQIVGTDSPDAATAAFAWTLDLDALARAGDLLPTWLRGSGAHATGTATGAAAALLDDLEALRRSWRVDGVVSVPEARLAGFQLRDFTADTALTADSWSLTGRESTRLDLGPLRFDVRSDLRTATWPTTLTVSWQQGQLQGGSANALRLLVPMFAGLDAAATVRGRCDFAASLAGPGRRREHENWLQWLDRWRGEGRLAIADGAVVPSTALAGLLAPLGPLAGATTRLGDGTQLAIDTFETPFRFAAGAITTTAGSWLAKGRAVGVSGTARLDGRLDLGFDLTALLRGHRDGERVLQALGGTFPPARLGGTVDAPMLGLPDFASALQRLAERELQQRGTDLLRKELEDLLRRSKRR